jgi:HSP20 family protein
MTPRSMLLPPSEVFRNELDRLFSSFLGDWNERWPLGLEGAHAFPAVNLWDDEKCFYVEAEIPGLKLENIDVSMTGDELCIKGERKAEPTPDAVYHRRERGSGSFTRVLTLPTKVDSEHVRAALKDGVLTVTLPKAKETQPRKIEVKVLEQK